MERVAILYRNLTRDEILHVFPHFCNVTKIVHNKSLDDEGKIDALERLLQAEQQQQAEDERATIFYKIFTFEDISDVIVQYFVLNYGKEFFNFITQNNADIVFDLPYLSNEQRVECLRRKEVLTRRDFHNLWWRVITRQDVFFANWLLTQNVVTFRMKNKKKAERKLLTQVFQVIRSQRRIRREFIDILVSNPAIDPSPALEWCQSRGYTELVDKIQSHSLFALKALK